MVRRGPAELDDTFAISAWYGDRGRRLVNGLPPAPDEVRLSIRSTAFQLVRPINVRAAAE